MLQFLLSLQLWQNFFQLAVAFTCQLPLQLEVISEEKRNRIMDSYGDMRIAMNSLMVNKWKALGTYQSRYVPGMIGPFLKVSLLPHTSEIWLSFVLLCTINYDIGCPNRYSSKHHSYFLWYDGNRVQVSKEFPHGLLKSRINYWHL